MVVLFDKRYVLRDERFVFINERFIVLAYFGFLASAFWKLLILHH